MLLDIAKELSAISPETAGRVTGWALYQIALTFATAGAGHLIKVSKAGTMCRALTAIKAGDLLADYPKVAVIVEKAMVAMTKLMNVACFVRGTPVHSRAGIVPIESVKKGDWLLARHEHEPGSANAYRQVLEVFINHTDEVLHIEYESASGRETLTATAGHPFFSVSKKRFVEAEQLALGDLLRLADDSTATVVSIERERAVAGQAITTYNFAVEEFRTFFVGQAAVWVHNDCPFELKPLLEEVLKKVDGSVDKFVEKAAELIQRPDNPLDKQKLLDGLEKEPIPKEQLDEIKAKLTKRLDNAAPSTLGPKIPDEWLRGKDLVDEAGKKIPGKWVSIKEWVADTANDILKKWKSEGVGQGARSGQHGVPYNRAAAELRQMAKNKDLLPEVRDELLRKATQFEQRAREINHPMH